ncbi:MAG: carbohydrate kinase family protein [Leptolinea sp.]
MEKQLYDEIRVSLAAKLKTAQREDRLQSKTVVLMHDFSLDRLVHVNNLDTFINCTQDIYCRKGGLYPRSHQVNVQGGCAANAATALGRLGVKTYFISRTDELGLALIEFYLKNKAGVDIGGVKLGGSLANMTALEIGEDCINIMINDEESFGPFGFDDLDEKDFEIIHQADLVGVFDWCLNMKGTDLASRLFDYLDGKAIITYYDTSDPAPRQDEIPELFAKAISHPALSYLNLNENELCQYAKREPIKKTNWEELKETTRELKSKIPARLNVHTSCFSAFLDGKNEAVVPTYEVAPLRSTGAGDAWNSGNIIGILLDLEPEERLLMANSVAAYYITSSTGERPTLTKLIRFIENPELKLRDI